MALLGYKYLIGNISYKIDIKVAGRHRLSLAHAIVLEYFHLLFFTSMYAIDYRRWRCHWLLARPVSSFDSWKRFTSLLIPPCLQS
jgi:hypothetical protein